MRSERLPMKIVTALNKFAWQWQSNGSFILLNLVNYINAYKMWYFSYPRKLNA
jgi:hypothetical protein